MREDDIDIVELMIASFPTETKLQEDIKFFMQIHHSRCNEYIYQQYQKETTFFNTIFKSLTTDLGAEIARTIMKGKEVKLDATINPS